MGMSDDKESTAVWDRAAAVSPCISVVLSSTPGSGKRSNSFRAAFRIQVTSRIICKLEP